MAQSWWQWLRGLGVTTANRVSVAKSMSPRIGMFANVTCATRASSAVRGASTQSCLMSIVSHRESVEKAAAAGP